jgi:hypothetical protein
MAGALRFEILSEGRYMKPAGGKRAMRRQAGGFKGPRKRNLGRASRGR